MDSVTGRAGQGLAAWGREVRDGRTVQETAWLVNAEQELSVGL